MVKLPSYSWSVIGWFNSPIQLDRNTWNVHLPSPSLGSAYDCSSLPSRRNQWMSCHKVFAFTDKTDTEVKCLIQVGGPAESQPQDIYIITITWNGWWGKSRWIESNLSSAYVSVSIFVTARTETFYVTADVTANSATLNFFFFFFVFHFLYLFWILVCRAQWSMNWTVWKSLLKIKKINI